MALGVGLLVLALASLAWALARREAGGILLASFAVPFFLEMGSLHAVFVRYMTPLVPVLCLFAATALIDLARRTWLPRVAWLPVTLGVLVLIEPLHSAMGYDHLVHHKDTRVQVYQFLRTVPDGLHAATYGPSVTWRSTLPRWRPEFYAKDPAQTWAEALELLRAHGVRYFLVHHSELDVFSPTIPELEAAVRQAGTLVRVFSPYHPGVHAQPVYDRVDAYFFPVGRFRGLERPGPLVVVYRLN
jgi:hypothetical protein